MTTNETGYDVVVAGGGPTGLTLGCVLAQWGVRVAVLDGADRPSGGSRAKGVQPRTLEVLDGLGLVDRVVARGRYRMALRVYGEREDRVGEVHDRPNGGEPTPDRPYQQTLLVPQFRVEEALRDRLAELGQPAQCGRAVTGFTQDADGVTVRLGRAGDPDGSGETVRARYLVGCDGGASTVRRQLGVSFLGETHDDIAMLLADVVLDGLDRDHWHQFGSMAERRFAMLCPLPSTDTFQLQAAIPPGLDGSEPSLAVLQQVVDGVTTGIRLREVAWASRWRLNVRMVDRYRIDQVFLAGDAAHVHSPAGAQGMNTGIQDAANLGWKLAAVLNGADPALLDSYGDERLPVAADVLGLSSLLTGRSFLQRGPEGAKTSQLDVGYRGGPLAPVTDGEVDGDVDGSPRAGDRAPDAPGHRVDGERVRLFDLFRSVGPAGEPRPHWTLLGFDVTPPASAGPVEAVTVVAPGGSAGEGTVFVDTDGHARRAYGARPGEVLAVRPDGYLGARGDVADVGDWLRPLLPAPVPVP